MKLLLVEDEPDLQSRLAARLRQQGFGVDTADDGNSALYHGLEYPLDLAIVDLGLPDISGIEVIRQWRDKQKSFPILILTARSNWQDKVEGLDAGADDYLVKSFHVGDLLARINALLRRSSGHASTTIDYNGLRIDTQRQEVFCDESLVDLTSYEYRVLEYLALNAGKVISKTELTEHIYEQDFDRDSNVIEVFVGRLRKKLDPKNQLKPIETVRGRGYRFELTSRDV